MVHDYFHTAGGQVRVDPVGRSGSHRSRGRKDELAAHFLHLLVDCRVALSLEYQLHETRAVAQIYEDQTAVVASPLHPAGYLHLTAGQLLAYLSTPLVSISHVVLFSSLAPIGRQPLSPLSPEHPALRLVVPVPLRRA